MSNRNILRVMCLLTIIIASVFVIVLLSQSAQDRSDLLYSLFVREGVGYVGSVTAIPGSFVLLIISIFSLIKSLSNKKIFSPTKMKVWKSILLMVLVWEGWLVWGIKAAEGRGPAGVPATVGSVILILVIVVIVINLLVINSSKNSVVKNA